MAALLCRICDGTGEVFIPERNGRVLPWSRTAICTPCDGTGCAPCGVCGERPGVAFDAEHEWSCARCADMVGPSPASSAPAEVIPLHPQYAPTDREPLPESAETGRHFRKTAGAER